VTTEPSGTSTRGEQARAWRRCGSGMEEGARWLMFACGSAAVYGTGMNVGGSNKKGEEKGPTR
jgi:hypothetical protein